MKIIPAIDIIDGKCVRLSKGDYATEKVYHENPLEMAKKFEGHGIQHLHLVDLDGAKAQNIINYKTLEKIASKTNLHIDFGGGLKTNKDLQIAFDSGAEKITGGSIAVKNPDLFQEWIQRYGAEKIILGADVKAEKIAIGGWKETSDEALIPFIKSYRKRGVQSVICTDISKDGMLQGPSFGLYKKIISAIPEINLIASGGISRFEELPELEAIGCTGTIIGKAIYEGKISLQQLEGYVLNES